MADVPTLIAEVGFSAALTGTALHLSDTERGILGTNTLGSADLFVDVSEYVTSVGTVRGARRADGPVTVYDTGTATLNLRNDDRRFDPTNLAGPYVSGGVTQVEPMRAARYRATWAGVTYPMWRGFTNQWSVGYDGPSSSWASVTCFDAFGVFAAQVRGTSSGVGASETTGARINRVLDGITWPDGDRMVSTGVETVQETTLDGSVLSELQVTADTELGELWMDANGRVVFRDRNAAYTDVRSTRPRVHFGDEVEDGDTTINLATNPSAETGLTGWTGGGFANKPTLSQSSAQARFGTYSVLATWDTATSSDLPLVQYACSGLTPGRTYTFSVYAYVPTGSPSVACVIATTGPFGTSTGDVKDDWERLTLTTTVSTSEPKFQIWPYNSTTTSGQQVYLDGLQIEEGSVATDYVDGAQTGGEWDGIAHQSTSRRLPELPAADVEIANDVQSIVNHISATREGGTEQTAVNTASQSKYLTRSYPRSDLLMETDAEALAWAEQIVARTALPELRVATVTLKPTRDERLWPYALGLEIGDRVRVTKRPPGGGDPIVREAWVRGVEHRAAATQEWETVLVLEQARDAGQLTATFSTPASNGFGVADTGQTFTVEGTATAYSVVSGAARIATSSINTLYVGHAEVGGPNMRVFGTFAVPVVPSGTGGISCRVAGRFTDTGNYYEAQVLISPTTGAAALQIFRRFGGVGAVVTGSTSVGTHSAGNTWAILFECVGTTVRAKAWKTSGSAPGSWTVSGTDSTVITGNRAGLMVRRETGNTNGSVNVDWPDFAATQLHAWE